MVNLSNEVNELLDDLEGLIDYARDNYWKLEIVIKELHDILKEYDINKEVKNEIQVGK